MKNKTQLIGTPALFSCSVKDVNMNAQSTVEHEIAAVLAPATTRDEATHLAEEYIANHCSSLADSPDAIRVDTDDFTGIDSPLLAMTVETGEVGIIAEIMFYVDVDIHDADYAFRVQLANINLVC